MDDYDIGLEKLQVTKPYKANVETVGHKLFRKREKQAKVPTSIWRGVIKHL
jgi:hypothetical protein